MLLGEESMLLQGFPIGVVSDLVAETPDKLIQDIAGNMVANPVMLIMMMSAVACVDWTHEGLGEGPQLAEEAAASEGEEGALHALRLLVRSSSGDADDPQDDVQFPCKKKIRCS